MDDYIVQNKIKFTTNILPEDKNLVVFEKVGMKRNLQSKIQESLYELYYFLV